MSDSSTLIKLQEITGQADLMTTLKTITTIELSNICNLSCRYCVNRLLITHPKREAGIMTDSVFEASLELLKQLCDRGTQQEVNVNGTGESCLDPDLVERILRVKEVMGDRPVMFCTNGVNITPELAGRLKYSGIDRVDISVHSPFHARRAAEIFNEIEFKVQYALGVLVAPHNWAGQLESENQYSILPSIPCTPLIEGRGYILKEGRITPCCYDYKNLGVFGSVFDNDILDKEVKEYSLCKTCHQEIPEEIRNANN